MLEKIYPWGKGTPKIEYYDSPDDSDVVLTVPTGKTWELLWLAVRLATTATVGNRSLHVYIIADSGIVWKTFLGANVAASQTGTLYLERDATSNTTARPGPGVSNNANVSQTAGIPQLILPAGTQIRIYDRNGIDAAADDMTLAYGYVEWDA
jgi:hypothetical protein